MAKYCQRNKQYHHDQNFQEGQQGLPWWMFVCLCPCVSIDVGTSPLTSLTPAPCRQHCDLLVVMWSSAEVLEDESSPWLSGSLSLSSMEANTALSIQTDTQQNTEQGLLSLTPLSPWTSYRVHPVPSCPVPPSCTWDAILLLDFLGVVAAAFTVFCEFIPAVHVNSVLKSWDAWSVEWPWRQKDSSKPNPHETIQPWK